MCTAERFPRALLPLAIQRLQDTTDIVWLVEKTVTLADGSTQKVLAPQVYARLKEGDLSPSGALIAAN